MQQARTISYKEEEIKELELGTSFQAKIIWELDTTIRPLDVETFSSVKRIQHGVSIMPLMEQATALKENEIQSKETKTTGLEKTITLKVITITFKAIRM